MHRFSEVVAIAGFRVYVERWGCDPERESVVLVNGALATTASFRQTARYLCDHYNVVMYDLPYAGQSLEHNPGIDLVSCDQETQVLLGLIDHYAAEHIISVSWGGLAALMAMSAGPLSLRCAVINSFSPRLNGPMQDYVARARHHVHSGEQREAAKVLNSTVGQYLPRVLKLYNEKFLRELPSTMRRQVMFHIDQILSLDVDAISRRLESVNVPALFVNGDLDEYTSASDVRALQQHIPDCSFATVIGAGHFLELEGRAAHAQTRELLLGFLGRHAAQRVGTVPPAILVPPPYSLGVGALSAA